MATMQSTCGCCLGSITGNWREGRIGRKKQLELLMIQPGVFLNDLKRAGTKARKHLVSFVPLGTSSFSCRWKHRKFRPNLLPSCHFTTFLLLAFEHSNIWLLHLFPVFTLVKGMCSPSRNALYSLSLAFPLNMTSFSLLI